jgi:hypothetical protein
MNTRMRTFLLILVAVILVVLSVSILVNISGLFHHEAVYAPIILPERLQPELTATLPEEPLVTVSPPDLSPTMTKVIQGPPVFTLLVTPVEVRAAPGGTVRYTMTIEPKGGFADQISLRLKIRALAIYRETFDLGTVDPPYPKVFEYHFIVPSNIPSGITLKGVLTGEGGGYQDTADLILHIR